MKKNKMNARRIKCLKILTICELLLNNSSQHFELKAFLRVKRHKQTHLSMNIEHSPYSNKRETTRSISNALHSSEMDLMNDEPDEF